MNETVIAGSRGKSAVMLLASLVFVAAGLLMIRNPDVSRAVAWLCLGFFGVSALVAAATMIAPNRIVLRDAGFTANALWRSFDVAWDDVDIFYVWKNPTAHQTLAAWRYRPGREPRGALAAMSDSMGAQGSVSGLYGMSTPALVELLNSRLEASRR